MKIHLNYGDCLEPDDLGPDVIDDCSHSGECYGDVHFHAGNIPFTVDREGAIKCLKGYGAWTVEELNAKTDIELAETVLWIACGNFADGGTLFCME